MYCTNSKCKYYTKYNARGNYVFDYYLFNQQGTCSSKRGCVYNKCNGKRLARTK